VIRIRLRPYSAFSRKEVIQPQVPLRLPCYDFAPVTEFTFDGCLLAVSPPASGAPSFHGVTGGVYKARGCVQGPGTYSPRHGWSAITSDSGFMQSSYRLQSELRPALSDWLTLAGSRRVVPAIVARVSPWA